MPSGGTIHIEDIQDQVELALMRTEQQEVARGYVIYREQRAQLRAQTQTKKPLQESLINVVQDDGSKLPLDIERLQIIINEACIGLENVSADEILNETLKNLYDGVSNSEVNTSLVMTSRTMVDRSQL